ncbi:MAG: class I SAM-dependent methyltransferase [Acidimicrobiia bacterium]|nr:class I SAM-dependent methyltransferase [Acidimicrobiia bacterium]MDH5236203.1 class I SAM-dependent methyltransferase [Acidimicrobiia bacterium]
MLTVDYDRLGLRAGELLLDLGCGFGRHAYEAVRRGADVIACDMAHPELVEIAKIVQVMRNDGEVPDGTVCVSTNGDATRLPFADRQFDHIIASEVMEHVPDDTAAYAELARVLRPGGTIAVTIPSWLPEKICWALSDDYHAPAVEGGHVRIYTERQVRRKFREAGLTPTGASHAHALHSPYWWLRCAVGPNQAVEQNRLVSAYNRLLTWEITENPMITRVADKLLNPLIGKSLVVYATKAIAAAAPIPTESSNVAA